MDQLTQFSNKLLEAEKNRAGIEPLTAINPNLTVEEAYQVQLITINRKVEDGQTIVGKKIGLTSLGMQKLLKVDQPDYGHLLNGMQIENDGVIPVDRVMQPKVEGEIAFLLKEDLKGPNVTMLDVFLATEYIFPALEIVDSRIADWKITLQDTIADNASSGLFVLGRPYRLEEIDLVLEGMVLYKNGRIVGSGTGAEAMGNPMICVAWLANKLSEFGISLKAGEIILSGAITAAVDAGPGDHFTAKFTHMGEASVSFAE